jgi:hypothetical protein
LVTLNHSTITTPLNLACVAGRRTSRRDRYGVPLVTISAAVPNAGAL